MAWHVYLSAVVPRLVFIFHILLAVSRVVLVNNDHMFWLLLLLTLPIFVEIIVTIHIQKGAEYKRFSPALFFYLINIIPPIWILEVYQLDEHLRSNECVSRNNSAGLVTFQNVDWILGLHQTLLIVLIIGKWILPLGIGVNRDQLSQLLLTFVGTAADILEFKSETQSEKGVRCCLELVYAIMALWTWSMLQFPLDLAVPQKEDMDLQHNPAWKAQLYKYSADLWSISISIFIQDGPFFAFRLYLMIGRKITHQMLLFFTIKNSLVLTLQIYRLVVIYLEIRQPWKSVDQLSNEAHVIPPPVEMDDIPE